MEADPTFKSVALGLYSYKARGRYAEQLERYYRFFPREQLLIVKSEDLFEDPQQTHNEILTFLGLPSVNLKSATPLNIGNYNRGPDPILESLRSYFEPHNRRLYDLLGRDMGW